MQVALRLLALPLAMKPAVVEAPAPRLLFQLALESVFVPLSVELHAWVIVAPSTVTFQPLIAALPAFTVTSPW